MNENQLGQDLLSNAEKECMTKTQATQRWAPSAVFLTLLLALASACAQAQTYDAVKDFSITSNPNGVWSYGWAPTLGGTFNLYSVTDTASVTGMQAWVSSGTIYD